jgi:hypothetical protein
MSNSPLTIPLPKSWPAKVRSAMLHVVSLAKYAAVYTRSWAADCPKARVRLRAERDRHQEDNALLREELLLQPPRLRRLHAAVLLPGLLTQNGRISKPKPSSPVGIRTSCNLVNKRLRKHLKTRDFENGRLRACVNSWVALFRKLSLSGAREGLKL